MTCSGTIGRDQRRKRPPRFRLNETKQEQGAGQEPVRPATSPFGQSSWDGHAQNDVGFSVNRVTPLAQVEDAS